MRPQPIEGGFIIAVGGEANEVDSIAPSAFAVAVPTVFLQVDEQAAMIGKCLSLAVVRSRLSGQAVSRATSITGIRL